MNVNFFDIAEFDNFKDALYIHKEAPRTFDFVLSTDGFRLPSNLTSGDLLIILVEDLSIDMSDLNLLRSSNCAGVIIFAKKIRAIPSFLDCVQMNLIISKNVEDMRNIMNKIMVTTSSHNINENMIRGIVDSILFKNKNYALLDWLYVLNLMNVNIFETYQVILIKYDDTNVQLQFYNKVITHLQIQYHMKLYSIWENVLICILPDNILNQPTINVMKSVYDTFEMEEKQQVKIALGNGYEGLEHIQKSLREALRTFDMIKIINPSDNICSYKMLGIYGLLYELNEPEFFETYCDTFFRPLIEYDERTQSHLFETIDCYFLHNCNLDTASSILQIHQNTLRYRLKKIEELMNVNLQNVNDITDLVTAFRVRRLNKILK